MNLKEAKKKAKETGETQRVTEAATEKAIIKVNISIRFDYDLLTWLKAEAKNQGLPYQIFTQSILRKAMIESKFRSEKESNRLFVLEEQVAELRHKLELKQG